MTLLSGGGGGWLFKLFLRIVTVKFRKLQSLDHSIEKLQPRDREIWKNAVTRHQILECCSYGSATFEICLQLHVNNLVII